MRRKSGNSNEPQLICLAEDDEDDILLFRQALADTGIHCELHVARNGQKLIEMLDELNPKKPDVIFLDMNMPLKNGRECLQWIRRLYSRSLPVFFLSTSQSHPDIDSVRNLGATGYLSKPTSFKRFTGLLLDILPQNWRNRSAKDFYTRLEMN